ncbi:hypothetical protein [Streptomyces sp. NPDC052535]|uniref:hypothetical protein n=1 Tax=Streptomyces sp. NPDC052535 TaxID=3155531 RepID=UPI0034195D7C
MPDSVIWLLVVLALSAVGTVLVVRRERRRPSSYSRRLDVMAEWQVLPTAVQARRDEAQLKAGAPAASRSSGVSRP